MVRQLRSDDDFKLAMLNELARIATALEETSACEEFKLQALERIYGEEE